MNPKDIQPPYTWQCKLNGVPTQPLILPELSGPSTIQICYTDNLEDTENVLEFNHTAADSTVLLDYLEYLPLNSTVPQRYAYTSISADDASLIYNPGHPQGEVYSLESGIQIISGQASPGNIPYATLQFTGPLF